MDGMAAELVLEGAVGGCDVAVFVEDFHLARRCNAADLKCRRGGLVTHIDGEDVILIVSRFNHHGQRNGAGCFDEQFDLKITAVEHRGQFGDFRIDLSDGFRHRRIAEQGVIVEIGMPFVAKIADAGGTVNQGHPDLRHHLKGCRLDGFVVDPSVA
jgi:hypothetical protein